MAPRTTSLAERSPVENRNPYDAPRSRIEAAQGAYGEIRIFTPKGRIGRIRYIGYTTGITLLLGFAIGLLSAVMGRVGGQGLATVVIVASYIGMLVIMILLTIQRAHDFNASGWMALVVIIPLVNLIFWFIPGTDGDNRFGPQTPPNGAGVVVLALILPIVFVVGIVAAIAIPAYQDYVKRAAATQNR